MDKEDAKEQIKDYYVDKDQWKQEVQSDMFQDTLNELVDSSVDIYYFDLKKWLQEDSEAIELMERVVSEFGLGEPYDLMKHIQTAQYLGNYDAFNEAWSELKEELEEEAEEKEALEVKA